MSTFDRMILVLVMILQFLLCFLAAILLNMDSSVTAIGNPWQTVGRLLLTLALFGLWFSFGRRWRWAWWLALLATLIGLYGMGQMALDFRTSQVQDPDMRSTYVGALIVLGILLFSLVLTLLPGVRRAFFMDERG